jgi:hypothetical protein
MDPCVVMEGWYLLDVEVHRRRGRLEVEQGEG